ncbi:hypothetical protein PENTCL1PPCAC_9399 [Pristionchus entomophagus]|uniref:Uncharacterized protein n=1 Tax=Pristionchus entomophagus TaxID=358040 RepID=A0AAV5T0W3_9BILA|nr:hypothetical protein PENTCL1PPCAC_9399 [Pristionchus entomophagus]
MGEKGRASKWGRSLADGNVREEVGHRLAVVRATNGLGENHRNIDALDLGALLHVVLLRDRVRHHDRLEGRVVQAGEGGATEDAVDAERVHLLCARLDQLVGGEADGATGVGHVIDQDGDLQMDVSDERHLLDLVGALALLVDEGEVDVEAVGDRRHSLRSSRIRRHDHGALPVGNALLDVLEDGGLGVEVVHGDVEEALDLGRVQVHRDDVVGSRDGEHVGDQLGGDGRARLVLLVLARVREARYDRGHSARGGDLAGVDHDEQLHEVVVDLAGRRLDDVHVLATHRLTDLHVRLLVGELLEAGLAHFQLQALADALRQGRMR